MMTTKLLPISRINFFLNKKISISREIINLLVERCRGDRNNLKNELSKIEVIFK